MNFKYNFTPYLPLILAIILCFLVTDVVILHTNLLRENAALKQENSDLKFKVNSYDLNCRQMQQELEQAYQYLQQEDKLKMMKRLQKLEPFEPTTILEKDLLPAPLPPGADRSLQEVLNQGDKIPFTTLVDDETWELPAYLPQWHSTVSGGRWSYVPQRIHLAHHRIFPTFGTASIMYDHVNELGIGKTGMGNSSLQVTILLGKVIEIRRLGQQLVFVYLPARRGYQHISLNPADLLPGGTRETFLFQLATPDGYEVDFTTISVAKPKF